MINKIMIIGYTYVKLRIKNPLDIFYKIAHTGRLIAWIPSRLAWTLAIQGRDQYLLCPSLPTEFYGTKNQEELTTSDTSTWYTLWDSGFTHYTNTYFELYTQYKPLEKGGNT